MPYENGKGLLYIYVFYNLNIKDKKIDNLEKIKIS